MENDIFVGDDGTTLNFTVKDQGEKVDITNCQILVNFKCKAKTFSKTASIQDSVNGICEVILDKTDINQEGSYQFQGIVTFNTGKEFASDIQWFPVKKRLV